MGENVEEEAHFDLFIDGPPLFVTGFPGRNLSITILFSFSDPNLDITARTHFLCITSDKAKQIHRGYGSVFILWHGPRVTI